MPGNSSRYGTALRAGRNALIRRSRIGVIAVMAASLALCVLAPGSGSSTVADASASPSATEIPVGPQPSALAIDSAHGWIYVANAGDGTMAAIDGSDRRAEILGLPVGNRPSGIAIDPSPWDDNYQVIPEWARIYVANSADDTVKLIPALHGTFGAGGLDTFRVGKHPTGMAFDVNNKFLYVANRDDGTVSIIDGVVNDTSATPPSIPVGKGPIAIAVNQALTPPRVYVANSDDDTVTVLQGAKGDRLPYAGADDNYGVYAIATIPVGVHPTAVALNAATNEVYVANSGDNTISIIEGFHQTISAVVPVGGGPSGIAVNVTTNDVMVTNSGDGTVSVIDGTLTTSKFPSVWTTIDSGHNPTAVAADVLTNFVYVTIGGDNSVRAWLDPGVGADLIRVPVRRCDMEGASEADHQTVPAGQNFVAGSSDKTDSSVVHRLAAADGAVWTGGAAHVMFYSAAAGHIPIISAPPPPEGKPRGWIDDAAYNFGSADEPAAQVACGEAWDHLYAGSPGLLVINVGGLHSGALGDTNLADSRLVITGTRAPDLCSYPRHIRPEDTDDERVFVSDPSNDLYPPLLNSPPQPSSQALALAHELGHALFLGHGNGLDDNHNGSLPPTLGSRLYDEYCEPAGYQVEDNLCMDIAAAGACISLMEPLVGARDLRPLQIETARDVARQYRGATADDPGGKVWTQSSCKQPPCGVPPDLFVASTSIVEDPGSKTTTFLEQLWGPVPPGASTNYYVLADLDDNQVTGCAPRTMGVPTNFQGAELVARVVITTAGALHHSVADVWTCQTGGSPQRVSDNRIVADTFPQLDANTLVGPMEVSLEIPDTLRGSTADHVRLQAVAERTGGATSLGRLPADAEAGAVLPMAPTPLPACATLPAQVHPGQEAIVHATGLVPAVSAEVQVGAQAVATGVAHANGELELSITIPRDIQQGLLPVTVASQGKQAACVITVADPPVGSARTIAHWPLDEGQGDVAEDVSRNDLHGSLRALPHYSLPRRIFDPVAGVAGLSLSGHQYIEVPDSGELAPRTITVEARVRSGQTGSGAPVTPQINGHIIAKGANSCYGSSYGLYSAPVEGAQPTGGLAFYITDDQGGTPVSPIAAPDAIWDGNWHHVAGTFDGDYLRMYVDGKEVGTGTYAPSTINYGRGDSDDLVIGMYRGSCQPAFSGDLADVRIWDGALTAAEVSLRSLGSDLL